MSITLTDIRTCLLKEQLLKEIVTATDWSLSLPDKLTAAQIHELSYDSRKVSESTLFFCKGLGFKEEYLKRAVADGLKFYVSETPYETDAELGFIVTDIRKAMAALSMLFFDYPQNKMTLIAFTGTKGKTTAAYFTKFILDHTTNNKTAMLSTMNSTLDGKSFFKSQLTTPESMDLYRMMAEAVENKMTHFVMEVSSQAYKVQRVYGLFYDVGIFLNISPDHISPIEHPTFDDYFYCKRQLIAHSKKIIVNRESDYFHLLKETAEMTETPMVTYGNTEDGETDYVYTKDSQNSLAFSVSSKLDTLHLAGDYQLRLGGEFNMGNALSAAIAAGLSGASGEDCKQGIADTVVPGRMEQLTNTNGAKVYVDYAHNYVSLQSLLQFVKEEHPDGRIIVVLGSPGDKAISRRKDFGEVLSDLADIALLTTDDPATEDPQQISEQIAEHIEASVDFQIIIDREKAIQAALTASQPEDAVVIAGKGADLFQKVGKEDVPYEGDYALAERLIDAQQ
ncbi:UDP-N-acetylmuramoyl-L-alanyl-D-glutamate--L-lysine ligase [uncultured Enterococcus sp.]|uniref:UDP-N-acetylmuramoyl-L-alanyl-D-glutamate--L- lysine ligase n=1 Tax=uncultured Enterococcus sp. TaxID=167972 RepID=UPI002AA8E6F3|nr:UDP-N-acetylmuramoyl-L-alanyl-D-glutamate--L-lysine ligase [uncultured Enterococcus sp.]